MYPVMLNVQGKKCVVVGGGHVALRKAVKLFESGANVTVISPKFCSDFNFASKIQSKYDVKYIKNSFLVIAATDNYDLNKKIADDAKTENILVSLVDKSIESDFVSPSSVTSGDITVAVSTNGKYPMLAKKLCKMISCDISFYNELINILEQYRKIIISKCGDTKIELLEQLISEDMIQYAKKDISLFKQKADKLLQIF